MLRRIIAECDLARIHYENGDDDDALACYCAAEALVNELTHPLEFLQGFVEVEHVKLNYIWGPHARR